MSILITRPSPAGEQLTQRLIDAGKHAFHAPLIEIAAGKELSILENKLNKLSTGDYLFLLSKNFSLIIFSTYSLPNLTISFIASFIVLLNKI